MISKEQIDAASDRQDRKLLLKEIGNRPPREVAFLLLPWLHDKSPRVSGRVLQILAHHEMDDEVETELARVAPTRAEHLRGRYRRLRFDDDSET